MINIFSNTVIQGTHKKPITLDVFHSNTHELKPVVIYAHGFNGFKDWGNFDIIATQFANAGFVFIKFNFSHNGSSPQHPQEFVDLEAYANNNYTKQLDDLSKVIDWTFQADELRGDVKADELYLLGHSLGGGISLIKAAEDGRIKKIATWASVSECKTPWGTWPEEKISLWNKTGVTHITNSRTKQEMPLNYQLYENYQDNKERLDIERAVRSLKIPLLICHGTNDEAVPIAKAELLKSWQPRAEFFTVESDHVFGRKHPWTLNELPAAMQAVVDKTISFFTSQ